MNRLIVHLILAAGVGRVAADVVTGPSHAGREIVCDLPQEHLLRNKGGNDNPPPFTNPRREPGKGSGLCVFTSVNRAAIWQDYPPLADFRDWMTNHPGGGWPEKLDQMIAKRFAEYKATHPDAPPPRYVQNTSGDESVLELGLKTGRMISITWGQSPRYVTARNPTGRISHMVNLVYLDSEWMCVGDNNFPGINEYEWVPRAEGMRRWKMGGGGWSVVLLDQPAPPAPKN